MNSRDLKRITFLSAIPASSFLLRIYILHISKLLKYLMNVSGTGLSLNNYYHENEFTLMALG